MKQTPLLVLRLITAIAGIILIAENYSLVAFQVSTYQSCGYYPHECGIILPYFFENDYLIAAGVELLIFSLLAGNLIGLVRKHPFYLGAGLLLVGIPLLAEGPVMFADSNGGTATCYAGVICWKMWYPLALEYWNGLALAIFGLAAVSVGLSLLFLLKGNRLGRQTPDSLPNPSRARWRLTLVCVISVLLLSVFFLVPFVPVQINSYSNQVSGANLSCDQIEPSVFPYPIFVYNASASPSLALLGAGNAIYSHCIVTSPANRSLPGPPSSCDGYVLLLETPSLTCLRIT